MSEESETVYHQDPAGTLRVLFQRIADYLPEDERPIISELAEEYLKVNTESSKGNEIFKGCRLPPPFSQYAANWMYDNWMPDRGDVLVAAYPKTGSKFFIVIITLACCRGKT